MRRPIQPGIRWGDADGDAADGIAGELREAAARWPSGVAVAAVRDGASLEAITLTSFLVVSLQPPLVLISINEHAAIVPLLESVRRFTINLLTQEQRRTASVVADRLPTVRTLFSGDAEPVLRLAARTLVCELQDTHRAGDHLLFVARVDGVIDGVDAPPLLYHLREYRRLAE